MSFLHRLLGDCFRIWLNWIHLSTVAELIFRGEEVICTYAHLHAYTPPGGYRMHPTEIFIFLLFHPSRQTSARQSVTQKSSQVRIWCTNITILTSVCEEDEYNEMPKLLWFLHIFFYSFQLYELSPDPKRKEFLDDLFNFMQKRGTCTLFEDSGAQPAC